MQITTTDPSASESNFLQELEPCLNHLRALKGSYDRNPDILTEISRQTQDDGRSYYTANVALGISVGIARARHLVDVYKAFALLIEYELPHCMVVASSETLKFQ